MLRSLTFCVFTLALTACAPDCHNGITGESTEGSSRSSAIDRDTPDQFPQEWDVSDIENATPPNVAGRVYILAWKIRQNRTFRVDTCLVLKVLDKDDGHGKWVVAHLCRHPSWDDPSWHLAMVHATRKMGGGQILPGIIRLQKPPDNGAIYAASEEINWSFIVEDGWEIIRFSVCKRSWENAIGEKPSLDFHR
jgi:hypothetical protein